MIRQEYNGWTNYPTWAVHLWLTNEEPLYHQSRELVAEGEDYEAAGRLKEFVTDYDPLGSTPSMFTDILGWAVEQVNWLEVARALREA